MKSKLLTSKPILAAGIEYQYLFFFTISGTKTALNNFNLCIYLKMSLLLHLFVSIAKN